MSKVINISLDTKSIKQAIKELNNVQKKLRTDIPNVFVKKCLEWVRDRANNYLMTTPMDSEITSGIQMGWDEIVVTNGIGKLVNSNDKAVFVEFGVGRIGQRNPHPEANTQNSANYQYNMPSDYKKADGSWIFDAQHKQYAIDLNNGYYAMFKGENMNRAKVVTKGSPANMYLYNASMDLISTGKYKELWQETLNEKL